MVTHSVKEIKKQQGGEGWKQQIEELDKILKMWIGNIGGGLHNILGVRSPLLTMTHEELFWKKDDLMV